MVYYIILLFLSACWTNCLDIKLNDTTIFRNGTINPQFNFSINNRLSDCSSGRNIFYEPKSLHITQFNFIKNDVNETFSNLSITTSNDIVDIDLKMIDNNSLIFPVNFIHVCNISKVNESTKTWSELTLNFNYNNNNYLIKFLKYCDKPDIKEAILSGLILFSLGTFFLYVASIKDIKFSAEDLRDQGVLKAWHGVFFILFGSITLMFIFYFVQFANLVITCIISIQSFVALYLVIKTFTENIEFIMNNQFLNKKLIENYSQYDLILILISLSVVSIWLLTKHWFLNNILGFCLVFTALSILHINNLKLCTYILAMTFLYDIFWVFISPVIFEKNVMETAAVQLNLPIKLEIPVFLGSNPIKDCVFLGLGDIIIPGLLVKFCKNLDNSKIIKIYFPCSILLYIVGLLLCGMILVIFNSPQPALFYLCPIMIIGIIFLSFSRNEFKEIWKGEHNIEHININRNSQIDDIFNNEFNEHDLNDLETNENINI